MLPPRQHVQTFLKDGPFPASFSLLLSFLLYNFADVWFWTADDWCRKRPHYQLSPYHCPTRAYIIQGMFSTDNWETLWLVFQPLISMQTGSFIGALQPNGTNYWSLLPAPCPTRQISTHTYLVCFRWLRNSLAWFDFPREGFFGFKSLKASSR